MGKDRLCTTPELQAQALVECGNTVGNIKVHDYAHALKLHQSLTTKVNWLAVTTHPQMSASVQVFASMHMPNDEAFSAMKGLTNRFDSQGF